MTVLAFDRILRMPDLKQMVGLSRSTIYYSMEHDQFPLPVLIFTNRIGWSLSDVNAWLQHKEKSQAKH